jgi:hypothetical protein
MEADKTQTSKPTNEEADRQRQQQVEDYFNRAMESSDELLKFVRNRERGLFQVLNRDSGRLFRVGRHQS